MTIPKVSIIIPTYNRPLLLKRAIESVINQEYPSLELLVVDDNPGKDNEKIVKSFPYSYIRYVRTKQREGIASKTNLGIRLSTGEYIAFLDDDDEWLPNKLKLQCVFSFLTRQWLDTRTFCHMG